MSSTWFPFLPSWLPSWLFVLIVLLIVSYQYFTWDFGVFKSLGIKGLTPYPILGTMLPMIQKGLPEHDMELKKKYGKVVGTFQGRQPIMMIYDTDILKQILIRDFTNFTNRFSVSFGEWPLDLMITGIKDDHWKHVRNILTPTFSSGKLRKMNTQVNQCAETLCNNLDKMAESKETFDLRSLCGAYTMDVIASTAFSVKIDSHNNPENQFVQMAKKAFNFQFDSPRTMLFFFVPVLMRPLSKFGFSIFPRDATDFFVNATNQALENREHEKKSGTDFLQIMINAHLEEGENKGKETTEEADQANGTPASWSKKGLTRQEVVAQSLLFFLAGYETTANTLSLLGYHLAVQPEIQEKLYKEIREVTKGKESVNSDMVQEMTYLDMCVNETLRMYPAGPRTDRVATNDVVINGVFIPKGMTVGIPIYALQNDPELWEEPEKFNPDRFRPEKRDQIDPMHFMPFGVGPRHCVGMRLALMEMKMSVVHILQKFKLITCSETQIPLQLEKLSMKGVNGIKLRVEKR